MGPPGTSNLRLRSIRQMPGASAGPAASMPCPQRGLRLWIIRACIASGFLQIRPASILLIGKQHEDKVRIRLIQFGTTLILTLCVWGHVSEIFDRWDNTFQTGYDIEYSTVIVVLVAGAVIAFAYVAAALIRRLSATSRLLPYFAAGRVDAPNLTAFVAHSPPRALRI